MTNALNEATLAQFTGTERYHRVGILPYVLTDGTRYVAEKGGAFWLMDEIAVNLMNQKNAELRQFAVALLTVEDSQGTLTISDGNNNVWLEKTIEYTDFPKKEIMFFVSVAVVRDRSYWVIMLPSEY